MNVDKKKLFIIMSKREVSMLQLSKDSGVAYGTVWAAMQGRKCLASTIGKLAKALNVEAEELIED